MIQLGGMLYRKRQSELLQGQYEAVTLYCSILQLHDWNVGGSKVRLRSFWLKMKVRHF